MKMICEKMETNDLNFLRYEIPNIAIDYRFSKNNWEPNCILIETEKKLSKEYLLRLSPFIGDISEEFYLENQEFIRFDDCLKTQNWAKNPCDSIKLFQELADSFNTENNFYTLTKDDFIYHINEEYALVIKDKNYSYGVIDIDMIEDITINIVCEYGRLFSNISLQISNITFKKGLEIINTNKIMMLRGEDPAHLGDLLRVDHSLLQHYFGRTNITQLLSTSEYIPHLGLFLSSKLFLELLDKNLKINNVFKQC